MTKGRRTTFDERVEIVQYCIAHNHNYMKTAEHYQVSYQQARNYVVKYETNGVEALKDNRGKRKNPDQIRDKNNNALVFDTVDNALLRNPGAQPLFHSDRGFQYTNRTFHTKLVNAGITQSVDQHIIICHFQKNK